VALSKVADGDAELPQLNAENPCGNNRCWFAV